MSQNTFTTTTIFNVSSYDSLNRLPLSSSQSTGGGSSFNIKAIGAVGSSEKLYTSSLCSADTMVLDQQSYLNKSTPEPQPSSYSPNGYALDSPPEFVDCSTFDQHKLDRANACKKFIDDPVNEATTYATQDRVDQQVPQTYVSGHSLYSSGSNADSANSVNGSNINGNLTNSNQTYQTMNSKTYSPKSKHSVQSFHSSKQALNQRYSITNFDTKSMPNSLLNTTIKSMLLDGEASEDIVRFWLINLKCEEYLRNFIDNGYDISIIIRMTPQDLTAIGCKSPAIRKKLLSEIKKLDLDDDIPNSRPNNLEQWLEALKLDQYYIRLCDEGYDAIDKVCKLTWEDLEEIGIIKLGHQKRLLLGIEKIRKFDKLQEERQNEYSIYDVHPNHRISSNQTSSDHRLSTLGRSTARSGFFQTRSGANLDHRGLPVATVKPALKHVNSSLAKLDISNQNSIRDAIKDVASNNNRLSANGPINSIVLQDLTATIKKTPPPLPPVRTNSLRIVQDSATNLNNNSIYANNNNVTVTNNNAPTYGPTSFLRTPKLGTLTATTNKMLTSGGHLQTLNGQSNQIRSMMPVREAPPPPPPIPEEEHSVQKETYNNPPDINSLISHQIASADEFPPPPPSQ